MIQQRGLLTLTVGLVLLVPQLVYSKSADEDEDVKKLVPKLKSKDVKERTQAAEDLGSIGKEAKAAVPALIELNKDKDFNVRVAMMQALGAIGKDLKGQGPEVAAIVKMMLESLKDTKAADNERCFVCQEALKSLAEISRQDDSPHVKTVVAAAMPLLKHKQGEVRAKAAELMQDCKDHSKAAVPALVQMLKDPEDIARKSAVQALREIDPETAKKHGIE